MNVASVGRWLHRAWREHGALEEGQLDGRFSISEWAKLPKEERLSKCREFALEAERLASTAPTDIRRHYIAIAEHWLRMSAQIEAER
jgi:hypothetical protein